MSKNYPENRYSNRIRQYNGGIIFPHKRSEEREFVMFTRDLFREASGIIGVRRVGETFHKSDPWVYQRINSNPRSMGQSPNDDPIALMHRFLSNLAQSGIGIKVACKIVALLTQALTAGET